MAKLKIWIAKQTEDGTCYNLIGKTKKEVSEKIKFHAHIKFDTIGRYEVSYKDAFDLFDWATSEAGGRDGSYKVLSEETI